MKRRTKWAVGGVLVLAVVAVGAAAGWVLTRPHPCRATFDQVRVGMTRAEVEATVGEAQNSDDDVWAWEESGTVYTAIAYYNPKGKLAAIKRDEGKRAETVRLAFVPVRTPSLFDRLRKQFDL